MSSIVQTNVQPIGTEPTNGAAGAGGVTLEQLAGALAEASDPNAAFTQLKAAGKAGKLNQLAQQLGVTPDALAAKAAQMAGIAPTVVTNAAQDPFASDGTANARPSVALTGAVQNQTALDPDYGSLKQAFEANGVPAPTEKTVKTLAQQTAGNSAVGALVDGVKTSLQTGAPLPTMDDYRNVQKNQINFALKDADGDDLSAVQSPAALVMLVMLKAKNDLQQDKRDALSQLQQYSQVSDGITNIMNNKLLPAQEELSSKVAAEKDSSKQQGITVTVTTPNALDLDAPVGKDGLPASLPVYKDGKLQPETQSLNQTSMTAVLENYKNLTQQVQQRISKEQTSYSGYDSQDSTLSNIISAVNKTYNDSVQAIVRNVHS